VTTITIYQRAKLSFDRLLRNRREAIFLQPNEAIQKRVDHIVNTYSGLVAQGKEKFAADPFVIAIAEVNGYIVVTEETGPDSLRKIPGVCRALNVQCKNLMELLDAEVGFVGAARIFGRRGAEHFRCRVVALRHWLLFDRFREPGSGGRKRPAPVLRRPHLAAP
jgi:hypothetical protein